MSPEPAPFRIVRCVAGPGEDDTLFTALVTGETCDFVLSAVPSAPVDRTAGVTTVTLDTNGIRRLNRVAVGVRPDDPRRAAAEPVSDALREIARRSSQDTGPGSGTAGPRPAAGVLAAVPAGGGR